MVSPASHPPEPGASPDSGDSPPRDPDRDPDRDGAAAPAGEGGCGSERPRPGPRGVVDRVRDLCRREALFAGVDEAIVMVSGGQDSTALLHLLASGALGRWGPRRLRALHVNHHLRGDESEADQALVESACAGLGVDLTVAHAPVDKVAGNVQAEARRARRGAARVLLEGGGERVAALAHTLDDQVETMLYRLGRYGGSGAVAGMAAGDRPWVRPFLTLRRAETASYCRGHGLPYSVDRGNEYPGYARTGLRERVVPAWEDVLPGAVRAAGRAAEVAAESADVVREAVRSAFDSAVFPVPGDPPDTVEISIARLRRLPAPVRRALLHALLGRSGDGGVSRALVQEVEELARGDGYALLALGSGRLAERVYGRIRLHVGPDAAVGGAADRESGRSGVRAAEATAPVPLGCPGRVSWEGVEVRAEPVDRFRAHDPRSEAYLDARSASGGLWVRGRLPGDRMRPLGAPGSRSIKEILVDAKVPRPLRFRVPVVGSGERILWLAGFATAEEGRIGADTEGLVRLSVGVIGSGAVGPVREGGVRLG